ncbi:MAG TPA: glycosyltransferase family A protein [Candidatus Limnocylindrales bacterium]
MKADAAMHVPSVAGAVKVTVVVPVFNPGRDIDRCIQSLVEQSLPAAEYEAIFVDDGSTDDTPARLDALSAEHTNIRVIHIPNSGWPGKPRNIGIANAAGTYVQLVDQDDYLGPEALERLSAYGFANQSDIVIGKVTSNFRGVPHGLFRKNRPACTIADAPLIDSLTPHKMFRRAFLVEHGIVFPEGPHILEDQLFMVRAYFPARVVSILADYPCYFYNKRTQGVNTASRRMDPPNYYGNLREVLDVVVANTEPGPFRDKLLRRSYRVEMLGRLGEPAFHQFEPEFRSRLFESVRGLALDYMTDDVEAGLSPVLRMRSSLLRSNREDDLLELARRAARMDAVARLDRVSWARGRLEIGLTASCRDSEGGLPLRFLRRNGRLHLDPALTDGLPGSPVELTEADATGFSVEVSLRDPETQVEWRVTEKRNVELVEDPGAAGEAWVTPLVHVTASIDPLKVAAGSPLPEGTWDVRVRLNALGLDRRTALEGDGESAPTTPGWAPDPWRVARISVERGGAVRLVVVAGSLADAVAGGRVEPQAGSGRTFVALLPVAAIAGLAPKGVRLVADDGRGRRTEIDGKVRAGSSRIELVGRLHLVRGRLPRGAYSVVAFLDGDGAAETRIGTLRVGLDGRGFLDGAGRLPLGVAVMRFVRGRARSAGKRIRAGGGRVLRRLGLRH